MDGARGARLGLACALGLCVSSTAWGADVSLRIEEDRPGWYVMEGSFTVAATREMVWGVLTDYDRIGRFVSSIRTSRVLERHPDHLLLEQVASGGVLFFRRRTSVLLVIYEEPLRSIWFQDTSGKDFVSYAGAWRIEPQPRYVRVEYRLEAAPRFYIPGFLARGIFRKSAERLLDEVRLEIMKRASAADPGIAQAP